MTQIGLTHADCRTFTRLNQQYPSHLRVVVLLLARCQGNLELFIRTSFVLIKWFLLMVVSTKVGYNLVKSAGFQITGDGLDKVKFFV